MTGFYAIVMYEITKTGYHKFYYNGYQHFHWCLHGDTLITMSDYSKKQIKYIKPGEQVIAIDQLTGQFITDTVLFNSKSDNVFFDKYDIWTFENNIQVKTLNRHRFYNVDRKAFIYMDEWNIGEKVRTADGKELKLINHEVVNERTQAYTIVLKNETYITNDLLTGTRRAKPITPYD